MDDTMHGPGNRDNEITAGSEDEHAHALRTIAESSIQNSTFPNDSHSGGQENASTHASDISTFSSHLFDRPAASVLSVTSATVGIDASISSEGASAARTKAQEFPEGSTRVKPRPAYRKKDQETATGIHSSINPFTSLNSSIGQANNALFSDIHTYPYPAVASIADRAKMRSRGAKSSTIDTVPGGSSSKRSEVSKNRIDPSDVIELSSSDNDELALRPAKSKKSRSKAGAKAKTPPAPTEPVDRADTIPKPRPRPRPIPRKKNGPVSPPPVVHTDLGTQGTIPLPTSPTDIPIQNPFDPLSSQLPPSDPPTSTAPVPESDINDMDLPPIETLANPASDAPSSSPSSLFTPQKTSKSKSGKNKKAAVDELEFDDSETHGVDLRMQPSAAVPQIAPPPTFFAASSSSLPPPIQDPDPLAALTKEPSPPEDIVDLSDLPPTIRPTETKKGAKPRKPRAKKGKDIDAGGAGADTEPTKAPPKGGRKGKNAKNVQVHNETIALSVGSVKGKERQTPKSTFIDDIHNDTDDRAILVKRKSPERVVLCSRFTRGGRASMLSVRKRKAEVGKESPSKKRKGKGKEVEKPQDMGDDDVFDIQAVKRRPRWRDSIEGKYPACHGPTGQAATISTPKAAPTPAPETPKEGLFPSLTSRYTIAPRAKSTPMSELIRRVNSLPGSPFPSPHPRASSSIRTATSGLAYSPYLKSSRSLLSRIAPLHPNRRTPPPPLPPPPPPKKTKKEKEREERWEEELVESVGGITEWACMTDAERKELRRAKRESEMAGWED
ncbi:hypothetical protein BD779DRAFT_1466372 [Infundibulicybe gibba]|nr:hypothetical protein BD779DRAFT_1466372 [Infundibulicybe gibba]